MRQVTGLLVRAARLQARVAVADSCLVSNFNKPLGKFKIADGIGINRRKQWIGQTITALHNLHPALGQAAGFSAAATSEVSSKDGTPAAPEEPVTEEKCDPGDKEDTVKAADVPKEGEDKEIRKLEQLIREKDSILEEKDELLKEMKENLLRSYAELENFRERTKREAESTRKYAIQNFAKSLLDVSDNLERASSCVPEDFSSKDAGEVKKLLKTLVEGVKMTEKEFLRVSKKFGSEKFNPIGEAFDPNVHLAICEISDSSKKPGTIATVFKAGYMLHDRILRPAEVAVVKDERVDVGDKEEKEKEKEKEK